MTKQLLQAQLVEVVESENWQVSNPFGSRIKFGRLPTLAYPMLDFQYMISNGELSELIGDPETATITAMIIAEQDGELTIQLPRNIIDSVEDGEDANYVVIVDDVEESADDDFGDEVRILTIPFASQSKQIDIIGTFVVPEFGAIAAIVLAVAIVSIIVATTRYSNKFSFLPKV